MRWTERGGLPRSALFHNVRGTFVDVSRGSGADLQLRGNGCVAADFDLDGHTDLYVTTAGYNVPRTATTRCSGTTATARSRKARARPGSTPRAGTPAPRWAT